MTTDILSDPTVKAGVGLLVLIILAAFAFFLVARLRDYTAQDWEPSDEGLSNLEEMRLKGDISEEEFRTIQSVAQQQSFGVEEPVSSDEASTDSDSDDP